MQEENLKARNVPAQSRKLTLMKEYTLPRAARKLSIQKPSCRGQDHQNLSATEKPLILNLDIVNE